MRRRVFPLFLSGILLVEIVLWVGSHFKRGEWTIVGGRAYLELRCERGSIDTEWVYAPRHVFHGPRSELEIRTDPFASLDGLGRTLMGRTAFFADLTRGSKFWIIGATLPFWMIVVITAVPLGFAIRSSGLDRA